jgi:hypothetical protein
VLVRDRISPRGDEMVELQLACRAGREKCLAYAGKAEQIKQLVRRLHSLVRDKGLHHIRDLHVRVEISGVVRTVSARREVIVTALRLIH